MWPILSGEQNTNLSRVLARGPDRHNNVCGLSAGHCLDRPGRTARRARPILDYLKMFEGGNPFPGFEVGISGN
jgi:hypothetical protein